MKIKPSVYAKTLVELSGGDKKEIASNFWRVLQKNKQYRDLPKILDLMDEEFAHENNLAFARVFSSEPMDEKSLQEVKSRLISHCEERSDKAISNHDRLPRLATQARNDKKDIIIKNIVKSGITGIIVQVGDSIIDMSLENKAKRLKQSIKS